MKLRSTPRHSAVVLASLGVVASLSAGTAMAASQTWSATPTDANWATAANWAGNAVPGATSATTNDVATFNSALANDALTNMLIGSTAEPIAIDTNRNIGGITFDTANVGSYVIGSSAGNVLTLSNIGVGPGTHVIQMTSAVTNSQVIAASLAFRAPSSTNGAFGFVNNAASASATLSLTGAITNAVARPNVTVLDGSNTGLNAISGNISFTAATQTTPYLVKRGLGTWILSGSNTFSGTPMTDTSGNAGIQVLDGVLSVQNNNALGSSGTANQLQVYIGNKSLTYTYNVALTNTFTSTVGGTLELANNITLDNGLSLNLYNGGTIRSSGSTTTNGRINVNTAANASATLSTVNASDVFTIGNGTNDLAGGSATSVLHAAGPGTIVLNSDTSTTTTNGGTGYAGGWSIDGGILRVGNSTAALGTAPVVTFGAGSTGRLQLAGNNASVAGLTNNAAVGSPVVENGVGGSSVLTVNTSAASTYDGLLRDGSAGTLGLNKTGASTFALTGANTYTGGTTIGGGTLLANNASGSATGVGSVAVNANGTIGGSGAVGGVVTVNSSGHLAPGSTGIGSLHVGSLTLNSGSQLDYDVTNASTLDQTLVDTNGGLTINGGQLNINGGTAAFTTNGVYNLIGYTGSISGTGISALALNGANKNVSTNAYNFGTAGGYVTLTIASAGGTISYWNTDSNSTWSTGPWTPSQPNAVSAFASFGGGGTAITANRVITVDTNKTVGTIAFNNANSGFGYTVAGPGTITLDNGASGSFITDTAGSHAINAPLALTANGVGVTVSQAADTLTLGGTVSGTGAVSKSGLGTLAITGNNTYTGGTTLTAGTLQINSGTSLGDASGNLTFSGGTLQTVADITTTRNYVTDASGVNVKIDTNGHTLTQNGTITAGSGSVSGLTKSGAGSLVLAGANTYAGATTVAGGTVSVSSNANLGDPATGAAVNLNGGTLATTATFSLDSSGANARAIVVGAGGGTVDVADTTTFTTIGAITGGTLTKANTGTLVVNSGSNTAAYNVTSGTLTGGDATNSSTYTSGSGGIGSGAVTLQGGSTLNFKLGANSSLIFGNALNVPTGQTGTINTGNRFAWTTTSLTGGGTLNVGVNTSTSRFDFNGNLSGFTGALALAGSGFARLLSNGSGSNFNGTSFSNLTLDLGGSVTIAPQTNSGGNTYGIGALSGSSATAVLGGGSAGSPTYSVGALNTNTTYAGLITGNAILTKVGTGSLTLTGANNQTTVTNVNGGTLAINGQFTLGGANYAGLSLNGGTLQYTSTLATAGNGSGDISADSNGNAKPVTIGAAGGTIDTNGNDVVYANAIGNSGAGGLTKVGLGKLSLNAAYTNTGATTVKAGTLSLGLAAHNNVLTGTAGADVQGGKLVFDYTGGSSPVASVKTILDDEYATTHSTVGFATGLIRDTTLAANQTIGYGDDGTSAVTVRITLPGDANLSGTVDFNDFLALQANFGQAGTRFDQGNFNYDGVTDFNDFLALQANFGQSVTGAAVTVTASEVAAMTAFANSVPEPTTLALVGLGGMLLGRRRRRA